MISVQVEKEIKQENKIFMGLTMRQAVTVILVLVIIGLFYYFTRSDISVMTYFGVILGIAAYFVGFKKKNGLYIEYYIVKWLKGFIFMNSRRKYRTKNKYITMLNRAYNAEKLEDMQDRRKKKYIEKRDKATKTRKTKLKAYN